MNNDVEYQLRFAQLELMKANIKRELAETDLKSVKSLLAEQNKALKAIRGVLNRDDEYDDIYSGGQIESIDAILKGLGL